MDGTAGAPSHGSYTANLLGNIRSHLAGLQGYDVMALELIQNADDARAEEVVFDFTEEALVVRNSGKFTYCGDLGQRPCAQMERLDYACDYHRIVDVGSGGKLQQSENIGRFGIGFLSTYQITDRPEIRSAGVRLILIPESSRWTVEAFDDPGGTTFFLPWARNGASPTRTALRLSHIDAALIERVAEEIARVLRHSMLFLRHVRRAEVRRDGVQVLRCELDRGDGSDLIVSFQPGGEVEQWHILRADAADAASRLQEKHIQLGALRRGAEVSIGLRTEPELLREGRLYAFLPTEQPTGLPAHINADFFPEADRKHVIFKGHQHEQAWNEMLVDAAAGEIARDPEGLLKALGHVQLWEVLGRAYELRRWTDPVCYRGVWDRVRTTAAQASIVPTQDGSMRRPDEVYLPQGALTSNQAKALLEVGGRVPTEELRPFRNAMIQLGALDLLLERFVSLLERSLVERVGTDAVEDARVSAFLRPLWEIAEGLLPDRRIGGSSSGEAIGRLKGLPMLISEHRMPVSIDRSYAVPPGLCAEQVAAAFPRLALVWRGLVGFPRLRALVRDVDLGTVAAHIGSRLESADAGEVVGGDPRAQNQFYTLLAELDALGPSADADYDALRSLAIWPSRRGLIAATRALLPGDFSDPIGRSDLLETSVLSERAREFLTEKLGVGTQTIHAYVQTVLPDFFGHDGPRDVASYEPLMKELAANRSLADDAVTLKSLASLPLVPTRDGGWGRPDDTYRRSEGLVRVLGDMQHRWLDEKRIPDMPMMQVFLDLVGVRKTASPRHLAERMVGIAQGSEPHEEARAASGEAFYALCAGYKAWKGESAFEDAVASLRQGECFPADGDTGAWHRADSLYAPFRAQAFSSQASILAFRDTQRIEPQLLESLGVAGKPPTQLVVDHLKYCMANGLAPHPMTYVVLNERAAHSPVEVSELKEAECIWVEDRFVRANQVYWARPQLGRYAFAVPESMKSLAPLFNAIGVKDEPEGPDYVDILVDLTQEHYVRSAAVVDDEKAVYDKCLGAIADAQASGTCGDAELRRLADAPTMLSLRGMATYPDEVLIHDSEWYASFFRDELNQALCRLPVELSQLAQALNVRGLTSRTSVILDYAERPEQDEPEVAAKLRARVDVLLRLLHDQPAPVRENVRDVLSEIEAVSVAELRIAITVRLGADGDCKPPAKSEPGPVQAFYDANARRVMIRQPIDDAKWTQTLAALFHQLMPGASGGEVSKLTLCMGPLMNKSVDDAHAVLDHAGVPTLDVAPATTDTTDLTSQEIVALGSGTTSAGEEEIELGRRDVDRKSVAGALEDHARKDVGERGGGAHGPGYAAGKERGDVRSDPRGAGNESEAGAERQATNAPGYGHRTDGAEGTLERRSQRPRSRPKNKRQMDRRLLSYVRRSAVELSSDTEAAGERREHNLAVETAARAAVCAYEEARGRIAEQMPQTHPGYDIVSHDPLAREHRLIEVKGIEGEWNQTGVGLTRLQFSNAQDDGDGYWLYVVEFATDPDHARVYPIRNPAMQVTSFMFDGNWREAATDERQDPTMRFVPGVRVRHEQWGPGEIVDVVMRGKTRQLTIRFDERGRVVSNLSLNLRTTSILEDGDGGDSP